MPRFVIDTIDDPRLEVYRDLPQRNLTRHSGRFIAEGDKLVERLMASDFDLESVLAEPALAERYAPRLPAETPVFVLSKPLLQQTVGFRFHRGVLACGRRKKRLTMSELLRQALDSQSATATWVVCPDVQDPTNLGSLIRSAAALGCSGVLLGSNCADPFSRRVLRVSMGAALYLPIIESRDLAADLRELSSAGFEIVAAVLDRAAEPLATFQRPPRTAILFGSEGHGLSPEWLALADRCVTIPMHGGIDSLNVAVAAAVVLWQLQCVRP
ncbi:MAG TPA: RNA methyltransferase [Pirellulaceae bacterium]|nr:RNA methyltransferase [Pirellulaceae bacterium]